MKTHIILLIWLFTRAFCGSVEKSTSHNRFRRDSQVVTSIVDDPKCEEVRRLCNILSEKDDILVLECLHALEPSALRNLNQDCQNVIWNHTHTLISNDIVKTKLESVCRNDLYDTHCIADNEAGSFLKCVASNKDVIHSPDCITMIIRLESVAFYDYKWIQNFLKECTDDIRRLQCGRIDSDSLTQSSTIICLQNHLNELQETCRKETYKLSEIQADNIRLDQQLYLDCAQDHMRYCQQFTPGSGRLFSCLLQLRSDKISPHCKKNLLRREKLIAQDYRVSKGLIRACKEDIKKSHCRRQTSNEKSIRLAQILLCLENTAKNGTALDPECEFEILDHRKMLMEDYRLSPEIVDGCKLEIEKFCSGLEVGGKTIHCLMEHARLPNENQRIGAVCQRALEGLVKQTDVAEDWRVDPVLHEACSSVAKSVCHDVRGGDARVISCLMDNIGADHMTDECEDALIQIQYFVARDFKLDPQLYRACRYDANRLCHASNSWEDKDNYDPNNGPLILPCLYRYAYHKEEKLQLNHMCLEQIKRVMRQRAISVYLIPEVEEVCLYDLAFFCFDKTKKGEEMQCLQKNMDSLQDKCHDAVAKYTEVEAQDVALNPYIMAHCRRIMEAICGSELKKEDGDVMGCLISHKNLPEVKADSACRISIEHFQIISLKDFRFSYKFKMACKPYAERFCSSARSKADVVTCLSEHVTNDTINGIRSPIQKSCRQQLKAQLFQQRESIDYDPKLKEACSEDIKKFCSDVEHGSAQVLECLQSVQERLKPTCEKEVFKVKKEEIIDNSVDYALMTMCEESIEQFCPQYDREHVLDCLKKNKDQLGFNKKCRLIVMHRMIEQNSNYRLNPSLQENCKMDIRKFCFDKIVEAKADKDVNAPVIKCLKGAFRHSKLTVKCEKEMASILHDQALDINLNPLLRAVCKDELKTICHYDDETDVGTVEECLKNALLDKKIPTAACQDEVALMIEESQADIQVDPLLQQACALDLLKFCDNVPQGNGRHIKCLQIIMDRDAMQLTRDCKSMLTKRLEMYKNAAQVAPPADFQELYQQVVASPSKHYFFLMIMIMATSVLVLGILCGRMSRKHTLLKNK